MKLATKVGTGAIIAAGFAGLHSLKQKITYPTPPAFYEPPSPAGMGEPGEIVRIEEIPWTMRTPGWRMLYRSTDHRGAPTIVSGLMVVPAGQAPAEGWPVVAVAHGTAGLPRGAAPSMNIDANSDETNFVYANNLKPFLDAGYAVTSTDYQGLGAPGEHSYLVGATEAANVLDSVRAIRRFSGIPVSERVFVWGHSQGGHAAAFAVERAPHYAPELTIAGAILLAPAVELRQIIDHALSVETRSYLPIMVMLSVATWTQVYPELETEDALTPLGALLLHPATEVLRLNAGGLCCRPFLPSQLFRSDVIEDWMPYLLENTPGSQPWGRPVLVQQGEADELIPPESTQAFVARLAGNGEDVTLEMYPGQGHADVREPAMPAAIAWMSQRTEP